MASALETTRREWEEGNRRLQAAASTDHTLYERLLDEVGVVTEQLRRRVGQTFTLNELAETVVRMTESNSEIVHEALPVDDPQVRQPDITRARQLLGWEPEVELAEGLRRMLPSFGREPVVA